MLLRILFLDYKVSETIAIIFGSHVSFVPMFYHSRKIQHILFKAYLCKYHENLNFKLKLIKRLKKLMIKIPASVLLLLIKKRMRSLINLKNLQMNVCDNENMQVKYQTFDVMIVTIHCLT